MITLDSYREQVVLCACCSTSLETHWYRIQLPKGYVHFCRSCSDDHFNHIHQVMTNLGWQPPKKSFKEKLLEHFLHSTKQVIGPIAEAIRMINTYSVPSQQQQRKRLPKRAS